MQIECNYLMMSCDLPQQITWGHTHENEWNPIHVCVFLSHPFHLDSNDFGMRVCLRPVSWWSWCFFITLLTYLPLLFRVFQFHHCHNHEVSNSYWLQVCKAIKLTLSICANVKHTKNPLKLLSHPSSIGSLRHNNKGVKL